MQSQKYPYERMIYSTVKIKYRKNIFYTEKFSQISERIVLYKKEKCVLNFVTLYIVKKIHYSFIST